MSITIPSPMLAPEYLRPPFTDAAWLYEIKFDGYRCLAGIEDGQAQLRTKNLKDCTAWFPEVAEALAAIPGRHVIDGEACVIDGMGMSNFNRFQERARHRRWYPGCPRVTLCAFDLLVHDGISIMGLPLVERKARLAQLLANVPKARVMFVQDFEADANVFRAMVDAGWRIEGVMGKKKDSRYQPGTRSYDWRKIKRNGAIPPQRFQH
jgi:bifunctional non-homologous end joining protein LigD